MTRREAIVTVAAPFGALPFVGCGTSGLIGALDVVAIAADAAVPVLTALAPSLGPFYAIALDYAKGIANATALSITEAQSADTTSVKYTKIFEYYLAVAVLAVPAGTATEVQAVISAITAAVQIVLSLIGAGPAPAVVKTAMANPLVVKYQAQVKALASDSVRIADAQAHAAHVANAR